MKNKSILMPHPCQWAGWGLLVLAVLTEVAKVLFVRDICVAWYFAKGAHVMLIAALFLICLSKETVEDEMIAGLRLKAVGITAYAFFVLLLILSLILEVKPGAAFAGGACAGAACAGTALAGAEVAGTAFAGADGTASAYLSELFVIVLPILLFVLYYGTFKWMLLMSRKQL